MLNIDSILGAIRSVLPPPPAVLHEPEFAGNEWAYVKECLDTGWVSSVGKFVDRFERMLVDITGVSSAVATCNGTSALHICLELAGVREGDEVLVPALTFVATANAIAYCGAVPHFVDSSESTLGVDPVSLLEHLQAIAEVREGVCWNRRTRRRVPALVAVHVLGHPVDLDPLAELCREWGIVLIEDAAESLGTLYKGRHTGQWGRLSAVSFNGNKIVTTGGGGAILTGDPELGRQAKHLTTTAKVPHPWAFVHDQVGYNYRMPNLNAALGCAQLERLDGFVARKRELADRYEAAFRDVVGVQFFREPRFARSNYWLHALLLDRGCADQRDTVLQATNAAGFQTRPVWRLLDTLPMYRGAPSMDLPVARDLERRIVNLPSSPRLVEASALGRAAGQGE